MKTKPKKRIDARFAVAKEFEPAPLSRGKLEVDLERLKRQLVSEILFREEAPGLTTLVHGAAADAAALAWATPFPLLLLPVLFEEKVDLARRRSAYQDRVWLRTGELLPA